MDILSKEAGCQIGMFVPMDNDGFYKKRLEDFKEIINRDVASVLYFHSWGDLKNHNFPWEHFKAIKEMGAIPHVIWEPYPDSEDTAFSIMDKINSGGCDEYIRNYAREVKKFKDPVYIRPGHEMNAFWYGWGSVINGKEAGIQKYIDFYRRVWNIFKDEKVTNVAWVWCPFATSHPDEEWNKLEHFYPGDQYVDWIGLDAYCWHPYYPYQTFDQLYRRAVADVEKLAPSKPVMIAEFSANKFDKRDDWIKEAFNCLRSDDHFSRVRAFYWFNIDKSEEGHDLKWAIHKEYTNEVEAIRESLDYDYFISEGNSFLDLKK